LCGSAITVDIVVKDGIIINYGQDVRACALGQASSTIVGKAIVGRSLTEVQKVYEELKEMLVNNGPIPSKPFDDLYMLKPASEYKNRHASILLAIEATLAAFTKIEDDNRFS
jgi:NifU-like protein involved in Fe-S cluster formation